jgi:hypothetical protein
MAIATSKQTKHLVTPSFDVVVEQVIAVIGYDHFGADGAQTAIEAGFTAIGKHVESNQEAGSPYAGGTFHFELAGVTYTVDVTTVELGKA